MSTFKDNYNINIKCIRCPYDKNHMIQSNRMPKHLINCEKRSAQVLVMCPFNGSHRVPKEQMEKHLLRCRDMSVILFEQALNCKPIDPTINCSNKPHTEDNMHHNKPHSEDNWD